LVSDPFANYSLSEFRTDFDLSWIGGSSSLAAASFELETLRSSQKDLEAKLAEAEKKLAEKNSELIKKEGEFELKRKVDSETSRSNRRNLADSGVTWRRRRSTRTYSTRTSWV
jgi:hypothetical protein